jgi:hypothetical protein
MRSLAYFVIPERRLAKNTNGATFAFPRLVDGQDYTLAFRFLDVIDGEYVEVQRGVRGLIGSIGGIDERPQSGNFQLKILAGDPVVGTNTTGPIEREESGASLQAKLNLLTARPSKILVERVTESWLIRREDGGALDLSLVENTLWPVSFGDVVGSQRDGKWVYELRLRCAPYSFTDDFQRVDPPAPKIIRIQAGFTADGGTSMTNEVQKLVIPQDFRAAFMVRDPRTQVRTKVLTLAADGEAEISAALNAILAEGESVLVTDVTTTGAVEVRLEFQGDLAGIPLDLFEIVVAPDAPPGDPTITLPLDRPELYDALRRTKELSGVPFEITFDLVEDVADEGNLAVDAERLKTTGHTVTLARSQTWASLASVAGVNWLRPPKGTGYRPFNNSMVGVGQLPFTASLGDGATTHFVVDHNLATQVLTGYVAIDRATKRLLTPGVDYTVYATDDNSVTLDFAAAPTAVGDNSGITFCLATPQSLEVFLAGFHIAIGNVDGLDDRLSAVEGRVTNIEAILPTTAPGTTQSGTSSAWSKRDFLWIFPRDRDSRILKVLDVLKPETGDTPGLPAIDESKLSAPPYLLRAIHDSTTEVWGGGDPLPDANTKTNQVLYIDGDSQDLDGGYGFHAVTVPEGGYIASDGRLFYQVTSRAGTRSYYPTAFEKVLFQLDINPRMLVAGATLELTFALALQLLRANTAANLSLVIEFGNYISESASPIPDGPNRSSIDWTATPPLEQRIDLSPDAVTHQFGLRVKRGATADTCDALYYANWVAAAALPPASAFAIRARLKDFDTGLADWDVGQNDERGYLFGALIGAKATITA